MKYFVQLLLLVSLCSSCQTTAPASTTVSTSPEANFSILLFSKTDGFYHDSIPAGVKAIQSLGAQHGFEVVATADSTTFTDESLSRHRVVVFFNTTGNVLNDSEQTALEKFVRKGGGFVGIHSASDTEKDWPWYGQLIGAHFDNHSEIRPATVMVADAKHPSTESIPEKWSRTDEWYNFLEDPSPHVRVLLTVDESTYSGGKMGPRHPIAWVHEHDGGPVWYTAMGHTVESYSEPLFLEHILGGIQWAAEAARR